MNKLLLIRGIYQLILPSIGLPGSLSIDEYVSITGAGSTSLNIPGPFTPTPGTFTTMRFLMAIRYDPSIYFLDEADAFAHNWLNDYDSIEHAMLINATVPPFNYSSQVVVSIEAEIPSGIPGAEVSCTWCEAFLEQATNLGQATT